MSFYALLCYIWFERNQSSKPSKFIELKERTPLSAESSSSSSSSLGTAKEFAFAHINYWTSTNKQKQILRDITGVTRKGTLTAIMGPSGCGKTTLLNLLSGRTKTGFFSGLFFINGKCLARKQYEAEMRRQSGYVLQEDDFFEELTVTETLLSSASLKLSSHNFTFLQLQERVDETIDAVGLRKVADSKVGGGMKGLGRLSGGQRRRLSIALEILHRPSILILDEPTSGLDSTASLKLIKTLHHLARTYHTTIVMTIHQPRAEIMSYFDSLLLLGEGRTVFHGPTSRAVEYLDSLSLPVNSSDYDNPGDYIIDAIGLDPEKRSSTSLGSAESDVESSTKSNKRSRRQTVPQSDTSLADTYANSSENKAVLQSIHQLAKKAEVDAANAEKELYDALPWWRKCLLPIETFFIWLSSCGLFTFLCCCCFYCEVDKMFDVSGEAPHYANGRWRETFLLLGRKMKRLRAVGFSFFGEFFQSLAVGLTLALAFSYQLVDLESIGKPYEDIMYLFSASSYLMVAHYLVVVPEYFEERKILKKELDSYTFRFSSYLMSSMMLETLRGIIHIGLITLTGYYVVGLNPDAAHFQIYCLVMMLGLFAWQGMVALVSFTTDRGDLVYKIMFMVLGLSTLFGGLAVTFQRIPVFMKWMYMVSIPSITYRSLIVNDLSCCHLTITCQQLKSTMVSFFNQTNQDLSGLAQVATFAFERMNCTQIERDEENDGTLEAGNLGRLYLGILDLPFSNPLGNALVLFGFIILFRIGSFIVQAFRDWMSRKLREGNRKELLAKLQRELYLDEI